MQYSHSEKRGGGDFCCINIPRVLLQTSFSVAGRSVARALSSAFLDYLKAEGLLGYTVHILPCLTPEAEAVQYRYCTVSVPYLQ